ncbi:MAG: hypothetical protein V4568_10695 [Pseudomonadota bacterium]
MISKFFFAAISLYLVASVYASPIKANSDADQLTTSVLATQTKCQALLHHDADEFVECVDALLNTHRKLGSTRLGIEYFGWAGALNSARISLPGAEVAADRYLRLFRKTQRALKVDDQTLCETLPGNCTQRIARMLQMEAQLPIKTDRFDRNNTGGHRH